MSTTRDNIRKGHRNQENGAYFEKMPGQLFTRMADGELARIAKVPEPLRGLCPGEKGGWRAIYIRGAAMKEIFGRKYLRAEDVEGMGWKFMMFDARGLCQLLHGLSLYQMKQKT